MTNIYKSEEGITSIYISEKPFPKITGFGMKEILANEFKLASCAWFSSSKRVEVAKGEEEKFHNHIWLNSRVEGISEMKDEFNKHDKSISEGVEIDDCFRIESEYKGNGKNSKAVAYFVPHSTKEDNRSNDPQQLTKEEILGKHILSLSEKAMEIWGFMCRQELRKNVLEAMEEYAVQEIAELANLLPDDFLPGDSVYDRFKAIILKSQDNQVINTLPSDDEIRLTKEYEQLLKDEHEELLSFAAAHGWQSSRHEKGKELRELISKAQEHSPLPKN